MPIAFQETRINFPPTTGRQQRGNVTVSFPTTVKTAQAMLKGFNIGYDGGDHHILREEIDIDSSISYNCVNVGVDFLLRDGSGNIDDSYSGWVEVVVIADVA
ncbi:MAG TPA: hypothetical protein VF179_12420 [Thermoanaerobaculia bacterium]|nr:hypothetical protein [Thermoanaerobaculia bacterium]